MAQCFNMITHKTCTQCKKEKKLNAFGIKRNLEDGRNTKCMRCVKSNDAARRALLKTKKHDDLSVINKAQFMSICTISKQNTIAIKATMKANNTIKPYLFEVKTQSEAERHIDRMYKSPKKVAAEFLGG